MQVYATDKEQIDQVMGYIRKYGPTVLLAILVFLAAFWGKSFYYKKQANQLAEASTLYDKLSKSSSDSVKVAYANDLLNNYDNTIYAKFGALTLGKYAVANDNFDEAIKHFTYVYQNSSDWGQLKAMAFENWLRVLLIQGNAQESLEKLQKETKLVEKYTVLFGNLEGDIYSKLNQKDNAIKAYEKTLGLIEANPMLIQTIKPYYDFILLKKNQLQ